MDIRQIVEDTLVAPMRAMAARPRLTVEQERIATEEALADMRKAWTGNFILHMGPGEVDLVLRRLDYLQMLADGYRRVSGEHERMVGKLKELLDADDLDGARDIVRDEFYAIHGPSD